MNGNFPGSRNAESAFISPDIDNCHDDVTVDHDGFVLVSAEHEHLGLPSLLKLPRSFRRDPPECQDPHPGIVSVGDPSSIDPIETIQEITVATEALGNRVLAADSGEPLDADRRDFERDPAGPAGHVD